METKVTVTKKKSRSERKSAAFFIVVFVLITLVLLTAYRFMIDTRINDWYLFTATDHTAWTLDRIGHSTHIQPWSTFKVKNPGTKRAAMAAWGRGEDEPTPEAIAAASTAPLSAWERYSYDALSVRRNKSKSPLGPSVHFILRAGTRDLIMEAEEALDKLGADSTMGAEERDSKVRDLEAEIKTLNAYEAAAAAEPTTSNPYIRARALLQIVSECGAIEIFVIFFASVIAFPTRWWKRAFGILVGLPILYCVNIFRLFCLFVIRALDDEGTVFRFVHEYVWQTVYIVFVVALWLAWMEYVVRRKTS